MQLDFNAFKETVAGLVEKKALARELVEKVHELCSVDVVDIGFLLEDEQRIENADHIFEMRLEVLHSHLMELPEAA